MRGPDAFPTVAGVAAAARMLTLRHPDLCRMRLAGESRSGQPLWLLSVGAPRGCDRHVLVVAGANCDEPAGCGAALWLAEQAVHDRRRLKAAGLTWDFLLCLDPDGALLNERGPAGRRPPAVHFRHTYRPAGTEHPHAADSLLAPVGGLPETLALSALVAELRPVLSCSLHGTDVGGAWVRLSAEVPGLAEPFGKSAAELDIPVQAGTYEALASRGAGPGLFVTPAAGQRYGGTEVRVEVPMWATRRVAYAEPHPDPEYALAVLAARLRNEGATGEEAFGQALELLGDAADGPLLRAARHAVGAWAAIAADFDAVGRDASLPLTMAHVAACDIAARRAPLRAAGMLLRLLDEARLDEDPDSGPARLRARLERRLDAGAADLIAAMDAVWVPIPEQMELQARTVLAAAARIG
ncbi:putative hydroxyacyl-CoA dehydrogenase [Actinacidiphila reveromycinica]|uniref:Putative hydroxyacyl-CoA dehydrogenase n=1 Tax=Actinacidiphila reveromycinica TaxID=659352 RepID=A0A7U3URT9_9ACTN|nr:M14 family zinc carboxypeptidase [Streptomyces sp. SN-593]BBA99195.1 putative hydroxyacyl-CoA dehydrogenase [Streptomyces sp. SN-593]